MCTVTKIVLNTHAIHELISLKYMLTRKTCETYGSYIQCELNTGHEVRRQKVPFGHSWTTYVNDSVHFIVERKVYTFFIKNTMYTR